MFNGDHLMVLTAVYARSAREGLNAPFEHNPNLFAPKIRKGAYLLLGKNMRGQNAPLPFKIQTLVMKTTDGADK